jgi:hypothetical protein
VRHHHPLPPSKNLYTAKKSLPSLHTFLPHLEEICIVYLQSRLSILDQVLKVRLVPLTGLGTRRERIRHTAEGIVSGRARIARAVRLATRLDPHEGIDERVARGTCGTHTEASTLDVAPMSPLLAETSDTVAGGVNDGLGGHACGFEFGGEESDVLLLVLRLVVLGVGGFGEFAGGQVVGVPAGDVGGHTADLLGRASGFVGLGEFLGSGLCGDGLVGRFMEGLEDILRLSFQPSQPP